LLLYMASATGVLFYGDDISMFQVTRSLVHGRLDVPSGTPAANEGVDGKAYSKAGLGQSLLGVPFFLAGAIVHRYVPSDAIADDRDTKWLAISGTAAAWAILLRAPNVLIVGIVALWLAFELRPQMRVSPIGALRNGFVWSLPIVTGLVVIAIYDAVRFGNVFES